MRKLREWTRSLESRYSGRLWHPAASSRLPSAWKSPPRWSASTSSISKSAWACVCSIATAARSASPRLAASTTSVARPFSTTSSKPSSNSDLSTTPRAARCVSPRRVGLPDNSRSRSCLAAYCRRYPEIVLDLIARRPLRRSRGRGVRPGATRRRAPRFEGVAGPQDFPVGLIARRLLSYRWRMTASRGLSRATWYAAFPPRTFARHRWVTTGDFDTLP